MGTEELVNIIANTGFPIAVSCYLLIRLESKITDLSKSINELAKIIDKN